MKTLIRIGVCMGLAFATLAGTMSIAFAHGEKAQEPFLRMRTIHWFDVEWTKDTLAVNDVMSITGKFKVAPKSSWPQATAKPSLAFLNVSIPGPVFHRLGSWSNGTNMANSTTFDLNKVYDFKVDLMARYPGKWHMHAMLNVKDAGPIIGPGKFITITGSHADFLHEVKTLTNETVNVDTYGLANNIFWHSVWGLFAAAWLIFWLVRPLFFSRYRMVEAGRGNELNSRFDKLIGLCVLVGAIVLTVVGYVQAEARWPVTLPLQSALSSVEALDMKVNQVKIKLKRAEYRVPGREMAMIVEATNNSSQPVRLGEFATATVRFINPAVGSTKTAGYPDYLLAENGLSTSDDSPIQPGETRTFQINAQDAAFETERLSSLIFDPDSAFGGLLYFYGTNDNERMLSDVGGTLVPVFVNSAGKDMGQIN